MAHYQQLKFVETVSLHINKPQNWQEYVVLEIGSHDVNGSIRQFFKGSHYTGVDLSEGAGVDVVASGDELACPDDSFDLTISCECFEHNPKWVETFKNMYRMTRHSGLIVITCASRGRGEHGTTRTTPQNSPGSQEIGWDYYKNLCRRDFDKHFDLKQMFSSHLFLYNKVSKDLYFVGQKIGEKDSKFVLDTKSLAAQIFAHNSLSVSTSMTFNLAYFLYRLPLDFAAWLPERLFQDFILFYQNILSLGGFLTKMKTVFLGR